MELIINNKFIKLLFNVLIVCSIILLLKAILLKMFKKKYLTVAKVSFMGSE